MEVFVPEIKVEPVLLGQKDLSGLRPQTKLIAHHPDEETRRDGYWAAYIVKGRKTTRVKVEIVIDSQNGVNVAEDVDTLWADVHWVNYGPFGRLQRRQGVVVPLKRPAVLSPEEANFRNGDACAVLPIRTHLLGPLDTTIDVLRTYAGALLKPGDVLTIGETPVAVIQGRYAHPATVEPGWLARLLCRAFHPTSSLATACGLQTLIDQVGPTRVLMAWILGLGLKLIGSPGGFYRLAGSQARLIDDVTGTTLPTTKRLFLDRPIPNGSVRRLLMLWGLPWRSLMSMTWAASRCWPAAVTAMKRCCTVHCARILQAMPTSALPWSWCVPSPDALTDFGRYIVKTA